MASELSANNPDLIESLRRNMNNRTQTDENTESTSDNNSQESTSIFNQIINKHSFILYFRSKQ